MDFLLALAAALAPGSPAKGKPAPPGELPTDNAAADFAAHMAPPGSRTAAAPEPVLLVGEQGRSAEWPAGATSGVGGTVGQDAASAGQGGDASDPALGPVVVVAAEQAGASSEATIEDMISGRATEDQHTAVIAPDVSVVRPAIEAEAADQPHTGQPDAADDATEPRPEKLVPTSAPGEATAREPAQTAEPATVPTLTGAGGAAPILPAAAASPTAASQASPGTAKARAVDARGETPAVHPSAAHAVEDPGAAERSETEDAGSKSESARPVEPSRTAMPREVADDQAPLPKGATVADEPAGAPQPRIATSAGHPAGDVQPARLPQLAGAPATGVDGQVFQVSGRAPDAPSVAPVRQPTIQQVALQISRAVEQDRTEIRIRLDPPELGEVDIQLEFRDLRLTASITAERQDTLDLLQRDARSLARALREAGLDCADADLSFARDGQQERDAGASGQRPIALPYPLAAGALLQDLAPPPAGPAGLVSLPDGRLDVRV